MQSVGVSNGLCEHLRACEQFAGLFLRARAVVNFLMRAASTLELQMAGSEHFVNFPSTGISLYCSPVPELSIPSAPWEHVKALSQLNHSQ